MAAAETFSGVRRDLKLRQRLLGLRGGLLTLGATKNDGLSHKSSHDTKVPWSSCLI